MPKTQEKSNPAAKANNIETVQASIGCEAAASQSNSRKSMDSEDIIKVNKELKTDIKGDNDCLKHGAHYI